MSRHSRQRQDWGAESDNRRTKLVESTKFSVNAQQLQWGLSQEAWFPGLDRFPAVDMTMPCFDLFPYFPGGAVCHLGVPQPSLANILTQEYLTSVAGGGGGTLPLWGAHVGANLMVSSCASLPGAFSGHRTKLFLSLRGLGTGWPVGPRCPERLES